MVGVAFPSPSVVMVFFIIGGFNDQVQKVKRDDA
jgi:hypothetical protein